MLESWRHLLLGICALLLAAHGSSTAADSFWNLPYQTSPLVQPRSGNLLPPLEKSTLRRTWDLKGHASAESLDGEFTLRLAPKASFSVSAPIPGGHLYVLEMEFQFSPDTRFVSSSDFLGLNGWVEPVAAGGKDMGAYPICEVRPLRGWQQHRSYLYASDRVTEARISLGLNAEKGAVYVRRRRLRVLFRVTWVPGESRACA